MVKKSLEKWQEEDAKRLKEWVDSSGLSQLEIGEKFGIGTQGMVWQYVNAKTPLNLSAIIKFSNGLKCSVVEISPTLAEELSKANIGVEGNHNNARVLHLYSLLSERDQIKVLGYMEGLSNNANDKSNSNSISPQEKKKA